MSSPSFDTFTDEQLAAAHLAGQTDAFEELVRRFSGPVYRLAYRFTATPENAQDIAQETFVRVYQHLPRAHLDSPLKPWIFQICANLCRNLAKRRKSIAFSQLEHPDDDGSIPSFVESIASDERSAADHLQTEESVTDVRRALAHLSPPLRLALSLYYYENLSYEEIATILSLPINTVRTHIHRAKAQLRKKLSSTLL